MSALAPQAEDTPASPRKNLRLRALTTLSVAFLAGFVATLTFGILVGVLDTGARPQQWAVMLGALTLMVTSSLLLIFVLILLIPNKGDIRHGDEFGNVFSYTWPVFFGLLIVMAQAAPGWGQLAGRPLLAAVCVTLLQIAVPHGYLRNKCGESRYAARIRDASAWSNRLFMVTMWVTVGLLLIVLIEPDVNLDILEVLIWILLLIWAFGLLFMQIWVEGTRKATRYARFPDDFRAQHPKLDRLLAPTEDDTTQG